MREQNKTSEKELNTIHISNLPNKEFKVTVIRMLIKLKRRKDKYSETFNKETENIKKNQSELKNSITEIKNSLERINNKLEDAGVPGWFSWLSI